MNVFVFSDDFAGFRSLFCEETDVTAGDGEKFVRLGDVTELTRERDFLLKQMREMALAQPFAMVDYVKGPHQRTPGLDTYKWFWWNSTARPIYKNALCDVVLSDGSIHFNVTPDFDWSGYGDLYVVMARHGANLDCMEPVDRPASVVYPADPSKDTSEAILRPPVVLP